MAALELSQSVVPAILLCGHFPYRKGMEVHFTPEQEVQLAQIAFTAGTAPEHLVKDATLRLLEDESYVRKPAPELPVWNLGPIGPMRRRDLSITMSVEPGIVDANVLVYPFEFATTRAP
jgi:hypothetical protein